MPRPSKPVADKGAPSVAKRLETHEVEAEQEISRVKAEIADLIEQLKRFDGDNEKTEHINDQIAARRKDLNDAYDLWFKLSKQVREYDKAVSEQRRDGEKLLRADVEEYFRQFMLSLDLAIESHAITISQEACRAESPTEFLRAHKEGWQSCKRAQIDAAVRDGKLPEWANA